MRQLTNDLESVKNIMEEIIQVATANDYASIEIISAEHITPDKDYQGVSVKFIGRIKQVRVPFSIDIGLDDVIVPRAVKRKLKTRLADYEEPQVYTYSIESTIAEKFDAILKRMEATSRMKDFFDIYYVSSMFNFEGRQLTEAVWETIRHRGTPYDADYFERIFEFRNNKFLVAQWARFQSTLQMKLPEFADVLDEMHQFLKPVFDSGVEGRPFSMEWSAKKKQWENATPEEA